MTTEYNDYVKQKGDTWPKILQTNNQQCGANPAMRYKNYGIWHTYSWAEYYTNVKYIALGLLAIGFKPGDKAIVVGNNIPFWYFSQLAIQSDHGISVGVYTELSIKETEYITVNSDACFAMVQDQEQVDKLLEIKASIPNIKRIVYWDSKGLNHYQDTLIMGIKELISAGKEYEKNNSDVFEKNISSGKSDDTCSLIYTSGATGNVPKGACHTYHSLMQNAVYMLSTDKWKQKDNAVTYLPPVWLNEQWFAIGCHMLSGCILNFAESTETLQSDIREIGPDIILYEAWLWEREVGSTLARLIGTEKVKQFFYDTYMPVGYKMADMKLNGSHQKGINKLNYNLANFFILRPIRDSLGLSKARICYATGSMVSPDAFKFYHALNIPLKSIYATTEGGSITCPSSEDIRIDTVGPIHKGIEFKNSDNSEMLFRHPGLFTGYYKDPKMTDEVLKEGWLYSGDSGIVNSEGHLVFLDRLKDIVYLDNGIKYSPQQVESRLRFSQYIKNVLVLAGKDRTFISAIVIIDYFNVARWASLKNIPFTNFADLSQKSEIYDLIESVIKKVNSTLPPNGRIAKFISLYKEFDPDELELTRNRKLRRSYLEDQYNNIISAIYSGVDNIPVEVEIIGTEGRSSVVKTSLAIKSIKGDNE
jgi:long-chain acyl-CoA synthetase